MRVKGEGNAGRRGAPPGDLIVFIRVKDHPELRRDGIDIHSDIDISYVDAILGSQVGVERSQSMKSLCSRRCVVGRAVLCPDQCWGCELPFCKIALTNCCLPRGAWSESVVFLSPGVQQYCVCWHCDQS